MAHRSRHHLLHESSRRTPQLLPSPPGPLGSSPAQIPTFAPQHRSGLPGFCTSRLLILFLTRSHLNPHLRSLILAADLSATDPQSRSVNPGPGVVQSQHQAERDLSATGVPLIYRPAAAARIHRVSPIIRATDGAWRGAVQLVSTICPVLIRVRREDLLQCRYRQPTANIHRGVFQREAVLQVPSIAVFHLDLGGYPYGVCQCSCSETYQRS